MLRFETDFRKLSLIPRPEGIPGVQGITGAQGSGEGTTGIQGITGAQGSGEGTTGIQGITGAQGSGNGITGAQGITGVGAEGVTVIQGIQGVGGLEGITGIGGITGNLGVQGITGIGGLEGITGVAGIAGTQGITGVGAPTGVQGITGSGGLGGITGIQGITGATITSSSGVINLTSGTPATIYTLSPASGSAASVFLLVTIYATNGTDQQIRCDCLYPVVINKSGTLTTAMSNNLFNNAQTTGAPLNPSYSVTSGGAIQVSCTAGITPTTWTCSWVLLQQFNV